MHDTTLNNIEDLEQDPLDSLAEEFAARYRRGEEPSVEEYAMKYPELADAIRMLFPTVCLLERGKLGRSGSGSEFGLGRASPAGLPIKQLGDNRIIRELGRGGMGVVYEAEQISLGRRVAIKVLRGHATADATSRDRFLREARAVARLKHANIVPIYAVGEVDDIPYLVMELVEGAGLDRLLGDERRGNGETGSREHARWVARLGLQAADALASAHEQGILHRDVKPANLLLDRSGKVWLADFGLARLIDDLTLTTSGHLAGTPRYLAPECLQGDADARSDVYSLGITLYELLVGRPAFTESDRIRLLRQVEEHAIAPPRKLDPSIPRDLETIVLKASAREPSARYATAAELADDLRRFLEGYPLKARRLSIGARLRFWVRRNPVMSALAATSALLAVFGAFFFILFLTAPPPPPPPRPRPGDGFDRPPPPDGRGPPPPRGGFDRPPPPDGRRPPPPRGEFDRPPPPDGRRPPPPRRGPDARKFGPRRGEFPPPPPPR
jgi:serine/threonine protein kinase